MLWRWHDAMISNREELAKIATIETVSTPPQNLVQRHMIQLHLTNGWSLTQPSGSTQTTKSEAVSYTHACV